MMEPSIYSVVSQSVERLMAVVSEADHVPIGSIASQIKQVAEEEKELLTRLHQFLSGRETSFRVGGVPVPLPAASERDELTHVVRKCRSSMESIGTMVDRNPGLNLSVLKSQPSFKFLLRIIGRDPSYKVARPALEAVEAGLGYLLQVIKEWHPGGEAMIIALAVGGIAAVGGLIAAQQG